MKRAHLTRVVAGVGTAVGAVIVTGMATLLAGCAPGTICDKDEYAAQCLTGGTTGGSQSSGTGGSSGGVPGTGGMPNAMAGTGGGAGVGGSGGAVPSGGPECKLWKTKQEVAEKLVVAKCGMPGGMCHANVFPPKFATGDEAVTVMLDKQPTLYCRSDKLINKADPGKSYIVTKVRGTMATVACPTGSASGGAKMPFMPQPALSADEADCLEWWAYEVSK
jgi:hypothetical protein